jgi:hypothetical protein
MPKAQLIGDTLTTFGWRESRQSPQSTRDHAPNVLQPAALANGLLANGRIARLSDDHALTAVALEDRPLPSLIEQVFLRLLTRPPTAEEARLFTQLLEPGFACRRAGLRPRGEPARRARSPGPITSILKPPASSRSSNAPLGPAMNPPTACAPIGASAWKTWSGR